MEPLPGALIMQGSEQSSLIVHLFYWSDSGILLSSNNNDHLMAFDPGQPGYAGTRRKHSPTHTHPDHRASFYHLSPFAMVHGILFIQLTCLTVLTFY